MQFFHPFLSFLTHSSHYLDLVLLNSLPLIILLHIIISHALFYPFLSFLTHSSHYLYLVFPISPPLFLFHLFFLLSVTHFSLFPLFLAISRRHVSSHLSHLLPFLPFLPIYLIIFLPFSPLPPFPDQFPIRHVLMMLFRGRGKKKRKKRKCWQKCNEVMGRGRGVGRGCGVIEEGGREG